MSGPFGSNQFFGKEAVAAAYTIDNSCMLDGTADYLTFTPSGTSTTRTKWTISIWFKTCAKLSDGETIIWAGDSGNDYERIRLGDYNSSGYGAIIYDFGVGGITQSNYTTDRLLRDPSAWYHLVASRDGATIKMYLNGVEITSWNTSSAPDASDDGFFGHTVAQRLGRTNYTNADFFNGYQAEAILILETIYTASDFGEFNSDGVWIPVDPSALTFGTNGFWLDFEDSSDLGKDVSGNANDFTSVSMSASNQTLDTPTDSGTTIGNFCTINPVDSTDANSLVLANGNLEYAYNTAMKENACTIVMPAGTGTWRWEWDPDAPSNSYDPFVAIITKSGWLDRTADASPQARINVYAWGMNVQATSGIRKVHDNTFVLTSLGTYSTGGIIGFFVDAVNGELFANYDGGTPESLYSGLQTTEDWYILVSNGAGAAGRTPSVNFGQKAYAFSAPSGYEDYINVLTSNLPAPTITKPTDQFLPILYEGNGAGQRVGNFIPFTDTFAVGASCRFDSGDSDFLSRTFDASDRKTWTFSTWVKRGKVDVNGHIFGTQPASGATTANSGVLIFGSANTLQFNAGGTTYLATDRLFLDTSSWHNIVLTWDTTDATAGDRVRIYYDGVELTNFSTDTNPALNFEGGVQTNVEHGIGQREPAGDIPYDGYLAETVFIDGTAYAASSFGETDTSTGRWIPKDVSGLTFGTNGTYLAYASENNLGDDTSGEGNDWAETNLDSTNGSNQMYDTPSQNFNVMDGGWDSTGISWIQPLAAGLTQGNLTYTQSSGNPSGPAFMGASTGKWYVEIGIDTMVVGANTMAFGIIDLNNLIADNSIYGENAFGYRNYDSAGGTTSGSTGQKNVRGDFTTFGTGYVSGDVFQIAMDLDAGHMWFAKNDTWMGSGDPSAGTNPAITGIFGGPNISKWAIELLFNASHTCTFNFGQWRYFDGATTTLDATAGGYFRYTPPTDFLAFQQDNLPANTAGITGFSWIKNRDATDNHILQTRVTGIYNYVESNTTDGQDTDTNSVQRFLQQGVQIGNMDAVNTSAESYVLWQWANDGAETSNGDGAITTTIRANTAAGFSMGTYTGDNAAVSSTIGHGLGVTPELVIVKPLERSSSWTLWHTSLSANKILQIDHNGAEVTPNAGYISAVSSTTITLAKNLNNNAVNLVEEYVFYAWFPVEGYSSFGSYVGNGDADGPFVCTGFRPSYLFQKKFSAVGSYTLVDNKRDPFNPLDDFLVVDDTDGTNTGATQDFLANGFKLRSTFQNTDTADYIYIAFAENPFGGSGVAQARAR